MMYEEFCRMLGNGQTVSIEDYKKIEFVYTNCDLFPNFGGKQKIVELYQFGGMELIEKLIPAAKVDQQIEVLQYTCKYKSEVLSKMLNICEQFDEIPYEIEDYKSISEKLWKGHGELLDELTEIMEELDGYMQSYEID